MTDANPETITSTPAVDMVISDLETLKVLADPLRLSIIELLTKPSTVKRVANKIGKPPTKLYYHFNLLEKHGLIKMVDTRIVSGIVEKHYQAAAYSFRVNRDLLTPGMEGFDENFDVMLNGIFADARDDLRSSLIAGVTVPGDDVPASKQLRLQRTRVWLTEEQAETFYTKLNALMKEYSPFNDDDQFEKKDPDAKPYSVLMLLHRSNRTPHEDEDEASAPDEQ